MSNKMRSAEPLKQQHLGICQSHMWLLHLPSWRLTALTVWFSLRQEQKKPKGQILLAAIRDQDSPQSPEDWTSVGITYHTAEGSAKQRELPNGAWFKRPTKTVVSKCSFIGWAYMSLPATKYALTMFTVVWKLARKCVKLRLSCEKNIQQTIQIPKCDKAVRPLLLSQRSFSWASIHRLSLQDKLPHAGRDSDSHPHPTPLASLWWLDEW